MPFYTEATMQLRSPATDGYASCDHPQASTAHHAATRTYSATAADHNGRPSPAPSADSHPDNAYVHHGCSSKHKAQRSNQVTLPPFAMV